MPERIQRKRTRGWKMPPNTVYVGRPTKFGNPYLVGDLHPFTREPMTAQETVNLFQQFVFRYGNKPYGDFMHLMDAILSLRGKNMACWCPLNKPCHADVLLRLANP